jgi:glucokinase
MKTVSLSKIEEAAKAALDSDIAYDRFLGDIGGAATVLALVAVVRAAIEVMSPEGYSANDWAALREALAPFEE